MGKWTVKVNQLGLTGNGMKVYISMERKMVMEYFNGLEQKDTKANGKEEFNMGKVYTPLLKERLSMENGAMVKL